MHPEIMPPACYENHISFFLYTEKKRGKHKAVGVIECEGLPQTSPSHPLTGTLFLYFPSAPFVYHFEKALAGSELLAYIWTESKFLEMVPPSIQDRSCLESLI